MKHRYRYWYVVYDIFFTNDFMTHDGIIKVHPLIWLADQRDKYRDIKVRFWSEVTELPKKEINRFDFLD